MKKLIILYLSTLFLISCDISTNSTQQEDNETISSFTKLRVDTTTSSIPRMLLENMELPPAEQVNNIILDSKEDPLLNALIGDQPSVTKVYEGNPQTISSGNFSRFIMPISQLDAGYSFTINTYQTSSNPNDYNDPYIYSVFKRQSDGLIEWYFKAGNLVTCMGKPTFNQDGAT